MEDYLKLSSLYYDVSKPIGHSLDGDIEFYRNHIKDSIKILEAGVGTGRLLIPYLEEGLNIEGIDLSHEMLEVCRAKALEHNVVPKLIHGSVVTYEFDKDYDAIIIPTGTIALFPQIKDVLKNFYDSLVSDGFILFDLNYPSDFKEGEEFTYVLDVNADSKIVLEDKHLTIDWINQKTTQLLTYHLWESGKLVESELQTFILNWYGVREMELMLKEVGFKNIEIFKNYGNDSNNLSYTTISLKGFK